jgi:putative phage-type endonuclease
MKLIDIEQNSLDWHEYRKNKIGASIAPIIMGVSPYKTPLQLYEEIMGYTGKSFEHIGMKQGHLNEERARYLYQEKYKMPMFTQVVEHDNFSWMSASLDGLSVDNCQSIEIKCLSLEDHSLAKKGHYPSHYYPQMQHQMAITGHEFMHYVSYYRQEGDKEEIEVVKVERNEDYIKKLIDKEKKFLDCLLTFNPPDLIDRDYVSKEEDKDWLEYSTQWGILQAQKKFIEKQEKELKEAIVQSSNGRNCKGFGLTSLKIVRKGNVDYTAIPELKTIDLEQYRKAPSEYWKIA